MDAWYVGDMLRALGLTPTQKLVEKLGGTKKRSKFFTTLKPVAAKYSRFVLPN